MAFLIGGANSAADTAYSVANSCRFNSADSAHMQKTLGSGAQDEWTVSLWIKRSTLGEQHLFRAYASASSFLACRFESSDVLKMYEYGGFNLTTTQVFRDVGAWYHIMYSVDTSQGSANDRIKLYVNGTQVTVFGTQTQPDQNADLMINTSSHVMYVGSDHVPSTYFNGYMAEFVLLDGTAAANTDLGEFDYDSPTIWKPKDPSGLTFGTSGFYLDFEASDNLGNDANGGTDLAETNFAAVDQATDSPTNSFCTMNSLYVATSSVFAFTQGNCELTQNASDWRTAAGTIALTAGKWYFEAKGGQGANGYTHIGWSSLSWLVEKGFGADLEPSVAHDGPSYTYYGYNGKIYYSTASSNRNQTSAYDTWDNDHTIGCYLDLDNDKAYWSKDGTIQNSGAGVDIDSGFTWLPAIGGFDMDNGGESVKLNFGGCPATTVSSAVADANGYGAFEYDPSDGGSSSFDSAAKDFLAICTKNLGSDGG